jgi:hypothetical protein
MGVGRETRLLGLMGNSALRDENSIKESRERWVDMQDRYLTFTFPWASNLPFEGIISSINVCIYFFIQKGYHIT